MLLLGGTSDIGIAIAREFASRGYAIQLAGRDLIRLAPIASDFRIRFNVPVTLHRFDVTETESHQAFIDALEPKPMVAVCAVGFLGDQARAERDPAHAQLIMRTNYVGPASILGIVANHYEREGRGTIIGISSVAGDRGRATNYIYGSAKAGLTAFLSGLRNRLDRKGVTVLTVKPGFVRTKMISAIPTPAALTDTPHDVARAVTDSIGRRDVCYPNWKWRLIMTVIRMLPERVFKRLNI